VAWLVCGLPVLLGFVLPVLTLGHLLWQGGGDDNPLPWSRFAQWCANSVLLAGVTAVLATALALALGHALRRGASRWVTWASQLVGLGYAVPGAVVVVGILLPVGWAQARWPDSASAVLLTSTVLGLVYAYLVRFSAVALQTVQTGYARLPVSLDDSARLLGLAGWPAWRRVHWPLMRRSTWTALLLVFVDVMKELPATLVLRPFDRDTLAVMANQLARDERLAEAALPSLAMVVVGLVPVLVLSRSQRSL
jgi:iron(III) transport system permease protein